MKKQAILLIVLSLLMPLPGHQAAAATSNGSSGGTKTSSSAAKSAAKSRAGSVNHSLRSYMRTQGANRSHASKNALQRTLPSNALYKGSVRQTMNQNPAGSAFLNYYFPYWMIFHRGGYTAEQKQVLNTAGIKEKELAKPREKRYWLLVEDQNGKEQAVLVSKKQYDSVQKGDHIKLIHRGLVKD
ncbi:MULTISPECIES: hypothetical protein [Bacillus]|uniref:hypothetical protein n=1 Tax=Bacillus TaxID=1386 RepID=UPI000417057C|nr:MULTISPECIES: hypothetical protein [Bacillus]QHZ48415.1 hypothetical protein M654_020125 [Bacillus sp. NSP9.1]WFA05938.1 hypothetical protein P3X63_03725 [Bacillus sp. HSf4]